MNNASRTLIFAAALLPLSAGAQTPASPASSGGHAAAAPAPLPPLPNPAVYLSAGDLTKKMARAYAMEKAGVRDTGPYGLMAQPPYTVTMEYRLKPEGHVSIHELNAEMFVVIDGAGEMTVGGKLVNPRHEGHEWSAREVQGGKIYKLKKGDILLVPPNTAHEVSEVDGKFAAISVHIPLADASLWPNNLR